MRRLRFWYLVLDPLSTILMKDLQVAEDTWTKNVNEGHVY